MIDYAVLGIAGLVLVGVLGRLVWDGIGNQLLNASGTPTKARVMAIAHTGARLNDNPVIELRLEILLVGGQSYQAKLRMVAGLVDLPRYQPGQVVEVMVDPKDPQRVALATKP